MIKALLYDKPDGGAIAPRLSPGDQFRYLNKNVNHLTREDKIDLCRIVVNSGLTDKLSECNEGVIVDMNIDSAIITKMYNFTYFKLNRQ